MLPTKKHIEKTFNVKIPEDYKIVASWADLSMVGNEVLYATEAGVRAIYFYNDGAECNPNGPCECLLYADGNISKAWRMFEGGLNPHSTVRYTSKGLFKKFSYDRLVELQAVDYILANKVVTLKEMILKKKGKL